MDNCIFCKIANGEIPTNFLYEDDLVVAYDMPHVLFRVPPLTLQPIVENAVKHGADPDTAPLRVIVRTRETDAGSEVVVEDGVERIHDPYRSDYLKAHLAALSEGIDDGVNCIGYTWWGPIDVVSAGTGEMRKRYGFIYVDKHDDGTGDLHRVRKDSFFDYQKIIREARGE